MDAPEVPAASGFVGPETPDGDLLFPERTDGYRC
jgi:hypothetical protein